MDIWNGFHKSQAFLKGQFIAYIRRVAHQTELSANLSHSTFNMTYKTSSHQSITSMKPFPDDVQGRDANLPLQPPVHDPPPPFGPGSVGGTAPSTVQGPK